MSFSIIIKNNSGNSYFDVIKLILHKECLNIVELISLNYFITSLVFRDYKIICNFVMIDESSNHKKY